MFGGDGSAAGGDDSELGGYRLSLPAYFAVGWQGALTGDYAVSIIIRTI